MPITKGYRALVDEALTQVKTYSVDEVLARSGDPKLLLLDIRDVRELQHEGTVPGSAHMPRCMLEFWVDPASPYFKKVFADETKEFVLFCNLGWRSALAAKSLQDMGMTNVAHMEGGYTEWQAKGGPTETMEERKAKKAK
ncbi:MAG: rhodanese-like domain-containing protein [Burkholderiales bacterium]|nr:rhodanese-like domain-containing protein [Burkholderiales bacterium]